MCYERMKRMLNKLFEGLFGNEKKPRTIHASDYMKVEIPSPIIMTDKDTFYPKAPIVNQQFRVTKEKENKPLLQIELDEYGSVPRVFYKGEEITGKVSIDFNWVTDDEHFKYGPYIKIVHLGGNNEYPSQRTIEYEDISND